MRPHSSAVHAFSQQLLPRCSGCCCRETPGALIPGEVQLATLTSLNGVRFVIMLSVRGGSRCMSFTLLLVAVTIGLYAVSGLDVCAANAAAAFMHRRRFVWLVSEFRMQSGCSARAWLTCTDSSRTSVAFLTPLR